jgi:hypothetical protein
MPRNLRKNTPTTVQGSSSSDIIWEKLLKICKGLKKMRIARTLIGRTVTMKQQRVVMTCLLLI